MHVLILGSRESIPEKKGAIERLTYELTSILVKRGIDVTIFTVGREGKEYTTKEGVRIYELCEPILTPPSYIYPMLAFSKKAKRKYEELRQEGERFDVIHSVYYPNLLGFGKVKEPVIVTEYNHYPWRKEFKYIPNLSFTHRMRWELDCAIRKLEAIFLLRHAKKVICVSKTQKEWISKQIPIQDEVLEVIYNFVDTDHFRPCFDARLREKLAPNDEEIILFVGRKTPHKGLHHLIKVLPSIEHTRLVVVGPTSTGFAGRGYDRYIKYLHELIERERVKDRVIFTGFVPNEDLPKYYSTADILALPSLVEAFGLVIVEAMACGTPVVAYNIGPIREIIKHKENGLLVRPGSMKKFLEALDCILREHNIRLRMKRVARRDVLENFSLKKASEKYISVYKRVISR